MRQLRLRGLPVARPCVRISLPRHGPRDLRAADIPSRIHCQHVPFPPEQKAQQLRTLSRPRCPLCRNRRPCFRKPKRLPHPGVKVQGCPRDDYAPQRSPFSPRQGWPEPPGGYRVQGLLHRRPENFRLPCRRKRPRFHRPQLLPP